MMTTSRLAWKRTENAIPGARELKDFSLEMVSLITEEHLGIARRYCRWSAEVTLRVLSPSEGVADSVDGFLNVHVLCIWPP